MKLSARRKPASASENTIPLINVVFLILIFFLIAGSLMTPLAPGLDPAKTRALPPAAVPGDVVQIDADGTLYHRGEVVGLETLLARLSIERETGSDIRLLADRELEAARLIDLLQQLRAAGHVKIRLFTMKAGAE